MQDINRVVQRAGWRIGASDFLRGAVVALIAALGAMIVMRIVERSSNIVMLWDRAAYIAAGSCVVFGVIWAIVSRPAKLEIARRVDEGANLKESLSTALCVAPRQGDDPWARATIETATRHARGVRVGQAVPITPPKFWPVPIALGLALAVVFLTMPRVNWLSVGGLPEKGQDPVAVLQQAKAEKLEIQNKIEEMTKDLNLPKPEEPAKTEAPKPEPTTAEEIRREELKQLGSLNDRIEQLRSGVQGQKLEGMQQKLANLKAGGDKTAELSKALAAGNFSQAKAELQKLQEQAKQGAQGSQGGPGSQQQKEAAKQLEQIAKQLDQMAKNQDGLKKQLEAAGIDPSAAAKGGEALQKAMQQAANLSDEQKQKLSDAVQAMNQSQQSMQGLAQAMQQMAEGMNSGDQSSQQQGSQGAMQQLSEMEQLAQDMASAAAAQNEAQQRMNQLSSQCQGNGQGMGESQGQGKNGENPWSNGWASRMSQGGRRSGQGRNSGGGSDAAQAEFETESRKSIGPMGQGPIVGTRMIEGESIKGESRAEFAAAISRAEQSATEAIENNQIPREYHNAIKNYFGRLKSKQAPGAKAEEPMPEPGAPAQDAGTKK